MNPYVNNLCLQDCNGMLNQYWLLLKNTFITRFYDFNLSEK